MSLDDYVHRARAALEHADSLFGSAPTDGGLPAERLEDAAATLRAEVAADMSGSAIAGYKSFAEDRASALQRLARTDTALNQVLDDAAAAENAAASASRSAVAAAVAHVDALVDPAPGGQRALLAALQSEVGRQQQLVHSHQQQANGFSERVRQLSYD